MYYLELILLASMEKPFEQPQAIVYILHFWQTFFDIIRNNIKITR